MSLPWMHGTVYQYVEETVKKLHAATPSLTHLKLGNFFVLQQATILLTATQLSSMLQLVPFNPQLEELTMSGIHIHSILDNSNSNRNIQSAIWKDLRHALLRATTTSPTTTTPARGGGGWKKISYSSCQGQGIQALSLPSAMNDIDNDDNDDDDNHEDTNSTVDILSGAANVKILHIAKCQLNHQDYDALGKFLQYSTTVIRLTVVEENLAEAAAITLLRPTPTQRRSAPKTTPPTPWSQSLATPTCALEVLELLECQLQSSSSSSSNDNNRNLEQNTDDTTITDENQYYSYSVFLQDLAHGLAQNTSLTTLNLQGCQLEDDTLAQFIRDGRLQDHPQLQRILLLRNHCGDQGLSQLASLVARSTNFSASISSTTTMMTTTDPTNNERVEYMPDTNLSAVATTTTMVPPSQLKLQQLDLSNQHLERAEEIKLTISHTFALALASPYCSLKSLLLKFNKLDDEDAIRLAVGLRYNNGTLEELDLRSNRIGNSGVIAIASTLHKINTTTAAAKGNWKSSNNDIDHLSCLSELPSLSSSGLLQLYLFGNSFGDEGATALRNAIQENYNMTTLNLQYSSCWYRDIQYYTCLNSVGRKLLQAQYNNNNNNNNHDRNTSSFFVPGLWPLVLARADRTSSRISRGICSGPESLFYFLVRGGPVVLGGRKTIEG
jgi:hypothetical protein